MHNLCPSKISVTKTDPPVKSKFPLLRILACSVLLGIAAGLPLIYRKNGIGLLVVLIVTAASVIVLSTISNSNTSKNKETQVVRRREILMPILSVFIGPTIAVGGGYISHLLSPMHPFDVMPMLFSLAVLGVFSGAVVGIGLWLAFRSSRA